VGLRVEFAGEVSTVLAYRSSNLSTIEHEIERRTPAFVPSIASADAPDMVRYRFDTIRMDANALGAGPNFSSIAAVDIGIETAAGGGGCSGGDATAAAAVWVATATFDFFNLEGRALTLESDS
jgi:hypothetical protein